MAKEPAALLLTFLTVVAVKAYWWDRSRPLDRIRGEPPPVVPHGEPAEGGAPH